MGCSLEIGKFIVGMEASSIVEGSFSAFCDFLGGIPHSFAGMVQQHVKKDKDKHAEERRDFIKSNLIPYDEQVRADCTDAGNECAQVFSHIITDRFSETNLEAQNCANERIECLIEYQLTHSVTASWSIYRRSIGKDKSRIVEEINGKLFCSCHKDINSGEPCRHIQCIICDSFQRQQFNDHWLRVTNVEVCCRMITTYPTSNMLIENNNDEEEASDQDDGVGVFVQDFGLIT